MSENGPKQNGPPPPPADTTVVTVPPTIPDYQLIRQTGAGAFGEVWLARSIATGRYRAIKIVHRARLQDQETYDTEFAGVKKFEEVSREHLGFVDILHISRNDQAGYFHYAMELADDVETGQQVREDSYAPKTLATELARRGRLPATECATIGLALAEALAKLHQHGLVHRDIKPSNIVFVRGSPKLADVGLVTEASPTSSPVLMGTLAYMDPQIHGTTQGDLYSLGKILYVMATGRHAKEWPVWPEGAARLPDFEDFCELDRIFCRACDAELARRYASADEIIEALRPLRVPASIRRLQRLARIVSAVRRYAGVGIVLAGLAALTAYQWNQKLRRDADLHHRQVGAYIAHGNRAIEEMDLLGSLPWFVEALRLDQNDRLSADTHRVRVASVLEGAPRIVQMWFRNRGLGYAAFADQENQVLAPAADGRWGVLDLSTGRPIHPTFGLGAPVETGFIRTGAGLAVTWAELTNSVWLWNLASGQKLHTVTYSTNLSAATLSPDGQWLAAAAADYSVVLWNTRTFEPGPVLLGHTQAVLHVGFSHDGQRLTTTSEDHRAILWDRVSARPLHTFGAHTSWVYQATFSPDDRLVATASFDRSLRLWDAQTGTEALPPIWHQDGVYSVEFSADGERLVTACLDFAVRVRDRSTGQLLHLLPHDAKPVYAAFSPSGRLVVTATHDGTIRIWDLLANREVRELPALALSRDGRHYIQHTHDALEFCDLRHLPPVHAVRLADRPCLKVLLSDRSERALVVTGQVLPADTNQAAVGLWDCRSGQLVQRKLVLPLPLPELVLSPKGVRLAVLATTTLEVWDLEKDALLFSTNEPAQRAAFDPADERLAIACQTKARILTLVGPPPTLGAPLAHSMLVEALVWSPHGHHLLTVCRDNSFRAEAAHLWDVASGQPLGPPLKHRDGLLWAAFSPDEKKIVTCGEDIVAILWDARTGRQCAPPLEHRHQVIHAVFSRDGRWVATACKDGTVRLWDAESGEPITPPLACNSVQAVQFLDGTRFLCAKPTTGSCRVWPLAPDPRPIERLAPIATVLSAKGISTEILHTPSKEFLEQTWEALRKTPDYQIEFAPPPP